MESNSFNDYNKRFFKVAHCRNHKYIDALKNGIKLKNAQMETYSQNLKEITIAKYKIDLKYT